MDEKINLLDWIVEMDFNHYKTSSHSMGMGSVVYVPRGKSHFNLKGSQERFTSDEIIDIFSNTMSDELNKRWLNALVEHRKWLNSRDDRF